MSRAISRRDDAGGNAAVSMQPFGALSAPHVDRPVRVALLGGFRVVRNGAVIELPLSAQRLVAFVALHDRPLQRVFVAGSLWLDSTDERANAALRTALWRTRVPSCELIDVSAGRVALGANVEVDYRALIALAERLSVAERLDCVDPRTDDLRRSGELLPDWYEDWVLIERERYRQLRLHALEALCGALTRAGRFGEAIAFGSAAVAAEPLRESAHRAVIAVHLAEGNVAEAARQYRLFRNLLRTEIGTVPSPRMEQMVRDLVTPR